MNVSVEYTKQTNFHLSPADRQKLEEVARERQIPMSALVRKIVSPQIRRMYDALQKSDRTANTSAVTKR